MALTNEQIAERLFEVIELLATADYIYIEDYSYVVTAEIVNDACALLKCWRAEDATPSAEPAGPA